MFNIYINSEGDDLFRVPDIYDSNYIINIKIKDVTIPDGYVGYFISYESPEKLVKHTGVLCKSDFIPYNVIDDGGADGKYFISKNVNIDHYNNNMHFYSSNLDITDKLDLNVDYIKIISKNSWAAAYNKSSLALYPSKCKYIHSENIPYINNHNINEIFKINNLELNVANDITNDRFGKGTSISMKAYNELFPNSIIKENKYQITQYNIYLALLIQFNNNIYTKNIKKLLRISPIFYNTKDRIIRKHFHSYKTYNSAIIYSNEGVLFNDADNTVRRITDNSLYFDPTNWAPWYRSKKDSKINTSFYKIDMDFVKYFQFICYDYMFNEDKSFLNKPNNIIFNIFTNPNTKALDGKDGAVEQPINTFAIGKMITPANSIDLFQNIQGESINHITTSYTNYNKNNINKLSYDKTIRRSSVIRDESRENSWRKFGLESYKNITENKGKITKLIGIGTLFLVHTEHSLFMFDMDNSLKTNNKEIQLYSPDTFEVQYKEIFTSNLGFGGLQDKESSIVDQFGYIFYDTDKSIFYRYDAGKLNMISEDIQLWLNKFKPVNVRFANDKKHNRLLISFDYSDKNTVLSYNYKSNTFISIHDIDFKFGVNTKNKLYLLHDYGSRISTEIYNQLLSNFGNNYKIFGIMQT